LHHITHHDHWAVPYERNNEMIKKSTHQVTSAFQKVRTRCPPLPWYTITHHSLFPPRLPRVPRFARSRSNTPRLASHSHTLPPQWRRLPCLQVGRFRSRQELGGVSVSVTVTAPPHSVPAGVQNRKSSVHASHQCSSLSL